MPCSAAAGLGDIGRHFPDSDERHRDADSIELLREVRARVCALGWAIGNVDATIIAQAPKMAPHIPAMVRAIAGALEVQSAAGECEGQDHRAPGFHRRGEGIAAEAVALIHRA